MYNIKCRLFVGNISENYSSTDLQELFSKYGEVVEATINVDLKTKRNLSYGFITYSKPESAQLAMMDLDGFEIHGRPLRVGKVINKRDKHEDFKDACGIPSVHVSYISYQIDNLVTVESLQALFSSYGTVLDVSIKRSTIDKSTKFQSGFGFIHYSSQQDGIAAAFQAAKTLYDERIENVNYTCKISHALEKFLTSAHAHAHAHAHAATRTLMGPPSSTPKGPAANKSRADPARRYDSNPSPSPGGGRCVQMQMQMQPHRHLDRDRDRDSDRDNSRMGSHGQQTAAAGLLPVDRSFDAELSPSQQMQMQCMPPPPPPPPYSPVIRQRPSHTPQHLQPSNNHHHHHNHQWMSQQPAVPQQQQQQQQPQPLQGKAEQWRVPPLLSSSDWDAVASDSEDTWEQPYQSTSSAGNSSPTSGMISSHSCPSRTSYDLDNGGLALYSESLDSFDRAAAQLRTSRRPARMEDSFSTAGDEWRAPSASSSSSASLSAASFDSGHDGSLSLPRQRQQQGAAPLHPARRKDSDWFQHGHGDEALSRSADGNSGMGGGGPGLLDLLHLPLAAASLDSAAYSSSSSSVRRPVGTARECGLEDLLAESLLLEEQRQGGRRDLSGDVQALFGPLSDPPARSQSSGEDSGYWHWDRRPGPSQLMRAGDTRTAHRSPFEPQSPLQRHSSSSSSTMGRAVDRPPGFGDEADNQHHQQQQQQQQHHHHHQQGGQPMSSRTALDAPPLLQEDSARRYPQPNTQQPSAGRGAYGTTLVPPAGPREAHLAASMGAPLEVTVRFHTSSSAGGGVIDVDPQTAAAMLGLLLQEGKQLQPQQKYQQQQQLHLQPPKGSSLWATPSQGGHPNPPRHGLHGTTTTSMGLRLGPPPSSSSREQPMSREQLGGSLQSAPLQLPRDIPPPPPRNEYAPRKRAEQPPGLANSPLGSVNQRNPYQQQRNPYQQQCNQYQYDHQFDYHPHHHPQPPPQQQPPLRYPGPPCDMRTCN